MSNGFVPLGSILPEILQNLEISPLYKVEIGTHSPAPMIFAAIDWLSISINLLLVIFVIVCLLMTLLILMQRPKQEGLGAAFGGGVTDQVFGARTTNVLQKGTIYCGSLFFGLALVLAILIGHQNKDSELLKEENPTVEEAEPMAGQAIDKPAEGDLPSSLLDELDKSEEGSEDKPEEGSEDKPAEGSEDKPAEGSEDKPVEGSEDKTTD